MFLSVRFLNRRFLLFADLLFDSVPFTSLDEVKQCLTLNKLALTSFLYVWFYAVFWEWFQLGLVA
jgi:hypothetical protein